VINRGNLQHDVFAPSRSGPRDSIISATPLEAALHKAGKCLRDAENSAKGTEWKVAIAGKLRQSVAAPYRWIAETLKMGHTLVRCEAMSHAKFSVQRTDPVQPPRWRFPSQQAPPGT